MGFCSVYVGETRAFRLNVKAEVWTPEMPRVKVARVAPDAQDTPHLVNIVGEEGFEGFDVKRWTRRFYELYNDEYDFLSVLRLPSVTHNRTHAAVCNDVSGIGVPLFDRSAEYGSAGRLRGLTIFPSASFYDGAERGYQHELGHQWINYLRGTPFEPGIPHWPMSDVASAIMGVSGNRPDKQGEAFPYDLVPEGGAWRLRALDQRAPVRFNDLELYLMGLLPPEEVQPHFVFDNQDQECRRGGLLQGPVTTVTIEDLVGMVGPRQPSFADSPKVFRVGTLIVSDRPLTAEGMALYDFFTQRAELETEVPCCMGLMKCSALPFYASTGGRGRLDTSLGGLREGAGG